MSFLDVNECEGGNGDCPSHSYCVNTVGSRFCHCHYGYKWDEGGQVCVGKYMNTTLYKC